MADFADRLTLFINANSENALSVIKGFGATATATFRKVEGEAAATGANAGKNLGDGITNGAASGILAIAAVAAAFKAVSFGKDAIGAAVDLERANAGLAAELKATGGAANATDDQINRLADHIQKTDVIFTTTSKSAATLLLTFREIRNEAGQGNDVFNRTLNVSAALSNVLGKDMNQAVIQLGRALENPQAGMQALSRSGVTLSQQTRETVLALSKQGDLLGAQKTLLTELEHRYLALGSALGKADPTQQFGVAMKEFKTQVGEDLLPTITAAIHGITDLLHAFDVLPGPVRSAVESLALIGIVTIPLIKLGQAFVTMGGSALSGLPGIKSVTVAEEEQVPAAEAATEANIGLAAVYAGMAAKAAAAAEGITLVGGASSASAAEVESVTAGGSALAALGPIAIGAAAGFGILHFATQSTGHDLKELQANIGGVIQHLEQFQGSNFASRLIDPRGTAQAVRDTKDLNAALIQLLDTQGADAAMKEYQALLASIPPELDKNGAGTDALQAALQPFYTALTRVNTQLAQEKNNLDDLSAAFQARITGAADTADALYKVADAFDAVQAAQDKVSQDKANVAGTGQQAVQAAQNVHDALLGITTSEQSVTDANGALTDAYRHLQDAQDSVTTSAHSLMEAQQALDQFNSPRGARERSLQLDIIQRRVVTTPVEEDQKQLDLLQFGDSNRNKQLQLQDALTNAQKSYRDALGAVVDAQRGVADAQNNVTKAVNGVTDAHYKLQQAVRDEAKVHSDAVKAEITDKRHLLEAEDAVVAAVDNAITKGATNNTLISGYLRHLDEWLGKTQKGGSLYKAVDDFYKMLLGNEAAAAVVGAKPKNAKTAQDIIDANIAYAQAAYAKSQLNLQANPANQGLGGLGSGVAGHAWGGMVPGPIGSPRLAIVHGGERVLTPQEQRGGGVHVEQHNHFHGDAPASADLEYANRALGWRLSRYGRS